MLRVLHILDATIAGDMLSSLRLLGGAGDRAVSLGPPPPHACLPMPMRAEHRPMGSAMACGLRIKYRLGVAQDADVFHAWSPAGAWAAMAMREAGRPAMVVSLATADRRFIRRLASGTDGEQPASTAVTVPTEVSCRRAIAWGLDAERVHVLPPAAEEIDGAPGQRERTRQALGLAEGDFVLVAPAEMTFQAGHRRAVWTHAIVSHLRDGVHLMLPGDGPARRHVQAFAATTRFARQIHFTGRRVGQTDLLAASDAAVFFHEADCGAGALAAAMAAGLAIVASSTPETAACAADGREALLVAPRDVRAQADAVLRLLEDARLARRLGRAARQRARKHFAPAIVRKGLAWLYAGLGRQGIMRGS